MILSEQKPITMRAVITFFYLQIYICSRSQCVFEDDDDGGGGDEKEDEREEVKKYV